MTSLQQAVAYKEGYKDCIRQIEEQIESSLNTNDLTTLVGVRNFIDNLLLFMFLQKAQLTEDDYIIAVQINL